MTTYSIIKRLLPKLKMNHCKETDRPWAEPHPGPPPAPDPGCRFCKGTGLVTLATTSRPCLDCAAPWEGWSFPDKPPHVVWLDADGREVGVCGVVRAGQPIPPGAYSCGRLSRVYRVRTMPSTSSPQTHSEIASAACGSWSIINGDDC